VIELRPGTPKWKPLVRVMKMRSNAPSRVDLGLGLRGNKGRRDLTQFWSVRWCAFAPTARVARSRANSSGWTLWEELAQARRQFGNPACNSGIAQSCLESFTVTGTSAGLNRHARLQDRNELMRQTERRRTHNIGWLRASRALRC